MRFSLAPFQVVRVYKDPDRILNDDGTISYDTHNVLNSYLFYEAALEDAISSTQFSYWTYKASHIEIRHRGKVVATFHPTETEHAFIYNEI